MVSIRLTLCSALHHMHHMLQRIAEEYNAAYGGGWDPDQLMHIWRRHAQRGPQARKGKWTEEEDETLLRVGGWVGGGGKGAVGWGGTRGWPLCVVA